MNNQEEVSSQISTLNKERIEIKQKKAETVRSQKYEEAARIRDKEKKVSTEILMLISAKFGIDFVTQPSLGNDILKILDLSCGDEIEMIETVIDSTRSTPNRETIEKLLLFNIIERYKQNQITREELVEAVSVCFDNLKTDLRKQINNLF